MKINPGDFITVGTVQSNTPTRDDSGADIDSWSTHATLYGRLEPLSVREFLGADARQGEVTHKFTSYHVSGITAAMRMTAGGRTFDIQGPMRVDESGRGNEATGLFLVLMLKERNT